MILNKVYKFEKSFKVRTTSSVIELKDKAFIVKEDDMGSYYAVHVEGLKLPILINKERLAEGVKNKSIVEMTDEDIINNYMYIEERVPIREESLLKEGFVKKANMYIKEDNSVSLIKGHTWLLSNTKYKFGKDVKFIDELK